MREWFSEAIVDFWESFHFEIEEITEASDRRVLVEGLVTARGKGSGAETQLRVWQVGWIANGKITRRKVFLDRDEALEAAGLRE